MSETIEKDKNIEEKLEVKPKVKKKKRKKKKQKFEFKVSKRVKNAIIQSLKIMAGSGAAMYIATSLNLEYPTYAGIITLLTLVTTRIETFKLSFFRIVTFGTSVILSSLIFTNVENMWLAYAIYMFFVVFTAEIARLRGTISVNAVIGTHFLLEDVITLNFVINELFLVLIGIFFAIILNIYHGNKRNKKVLLADIKYIEKEMKSIFKKLARDLTDKKVDEDLLLDTYNLKIKIEEFIFESDRYKSNALSADKNYYYEHFNMRHMQCESLIALEAELVKLTEDDECITFVADYILELRKNLDKFANIEKQLKAVEKLYVEMFDEELPSTKVEVENRARLFYIIKGLEEVINYKKEFYENIRYKKEYKEIVETLK